MKIKLPLIPGKLLPQGKPSSRRFRLAVEKARKKPFDAYGPDHRIIITLALLCLMLLALPDITQAATAEEITDRVQKNYEQITDFKASFIQEITLKTLRKTEREEGIVYFKNPKRMLWNYEKPKVKKLIINPKQAWLYIPDDHVAYLQSADSIFKSRVLIKFLTGIGKIGDDFSVQFSQPDAADADGNHLLTLVPKDRDLGVKELYLTVNKETYQISKCRFSDEYGNVTQITFKNMEINKRIPDHLFYFKPPAGVEIMKAP